MSSAGMPTGGRSGESGRAARTAGWSGKVRAASSRLRRRRATQAPAPTASPDGGTYARRYHGRIR